jgi:Endoribonuclease YicC-like, N-terminal region
MYLKIYSLAAGNFRIVREMKSMTGYGRGECARDGFKITVELGAVNRRQSEISVNLPPPCLQKTVLF